MLYYSIWCPALGVVAEVVRIRCVVLFTGVSCVSDTIWSSIIRIQPNTPEDGHIDARNMQSCL